MFACTTYTIVLFVISRSINFVISENFPKNRSLIRLDNKTVQQPQWYGEILETYISDLVYFFFFFSFLLSSGHPPREVYFLSYFFYLKSLSFVISIFMPGVTMVMIEHECHWSLFLSIKRILIVDFIIFCVVHLQFPFGCFS